MSTDVMQALILTAIAILIIILIARIKVQIRRMIKNEVFNNFPSVKHQMDALGTRIDFLNAKADALENKIKELKKNMGE